MAVVTVSGEPGCRSEEVARYAAHRLGFELITEARLGSLIQEEFGKDNALPHKAYPHAVASMLARLAMEHHMVLAATGAELALRKFPNLLRVRIAAPEAHRVGSLMVDRRTDRTAARKLMHDLTLEQRSERRRKFGRSSARVEDFDLILNLGFLNSEQAAVMIEAAVKATGLMEMGLLTSSSEANLQFHTRLELARHGIAPPSRATLKRTVFGHPSEQIFANLLDFYRIAWEYEPRSFPIQWDKDGKPLEAFTPDFYLQEFDLYVELTTMKQANVTKKNRKVKLLRSIYPNVNIQVFYQKDFQNLIFKYGLAGRVLQT
ncbi:MAG TPA: cytidylate kinase family protein [Bryobacteraceae bacterium]|nr:cytidylate kinase family protein [Bryobacteraceae bacterium]